ncbi:MAG: 8-amino-7-oxononanoate synthase [Desulfobulbaceae bacterium]|nr:8-amino-7-oxononanoate synthase [Desulfobulbaceae bacterium]
MVDINLHLKNKLRRLEEQDLARNLVPLTHLSHSRVHASGQTWLNLSGNDYLGLAGDREMVGAFYRQLQPDTLLENFGPGAAASRLMTGNSPLYRQLENRLATLYGKESSLVFNSGYHGNAGILPALAGKGDLILADRLCHASLIDGMRLSRAETLRFRHLDYDHLEEILSARRDQYDQVFLVSESVFSMDGDQVDPDRLIALKKKYRCCLYLDEAHAIGVFGRRGLGLAEEHGVMADIDLLFGTFGKALGGVGGFVACSAIVADYLVSRARPLIFTTGLPPVCLSWLLFVLDRIPFMQEKRRRLRRLADDMRSRFAGLGLSVRGNSQIVPVIIGDCGRTLAAAGKLRENGYWVTAVRPPTVPEGTARLRLSFSAAMQEDDLESLPQILASILR